MFITNEAFRSPVAPLFGSTDEAHWSLAELALQKPWFLLTLRQTVDIESEPWGMKRTVLLSDDNQVAQILASSESDELVVDSLLMVSPGHTNGTSQWAMDVIRRIWNAHEPDLDTQVASVYETISGQRYANSLLGTAAEDLVIESLKLELPIVVELA